MLEVEIRILPEADDFLTSLADVLVSEGYKPTYESAERMVDEIIDFISNLASVSHYKVSSSTEYHFPDMVKTCGMLSSTVKVLPVLHGMCFLKNVTTVY